MNDMLNTQISSKMKLQFGELNITPSVVNRLDGLGYDVRSLEAAISAHKSYGNGEPSLYIGTYAKYAAGSLRGLWIDLSSFDDFNSFIKFCKAIHADEADPELMAQDFEGFPQQFYHECFNDEEDFNNIKAYADMCKEYGAEAVNDFMELSDDLEGFEDSYCGQFDSELDFAYHMADETLDVEARMGSLSIYFDYEAFGRDLFLTDYTMGSNGHVFRK